MSTNAEWIAEEERRHYPMHEGVCASCGRTVPVGACFVGAEVHEACKQCIAFANIWQICASWWWR